MDNLQTQIDRLGPRGAGPGQPRAERGALQTLDFGRDSGLLRWARGEDLSWQKLFTTHRAGAIVLDTFGITDFLITSARDYVNLIGYLPPGGFAKTELRRIFTAIGRSHPDIQSARLSWVFDGGQTDDEVVIMATNQAWTLRICWADLDNLAFDATDILLRADADEGKKRDWVGLIKLGLLIIAIACVCVGLAALVVFVVAATTLILVVFLLDELITGGETTKAFSAALGRLLRLIFDDWGRKPVGAAMRDISAHSRLAGGRLEGLR